MTGHMNI